MPENIEPVAELLPRRSRQKIASAIRDIKAGMSKTTISDERLKEYMEWGRK